MCTESVEYIYDGYRKVKDVIIPPELWGAELFEPSKYKGKDLEKSLRELREEWEKDF